MKARVIGENKWYEYWEEYHDYDDELGGSENMSTIVRLVNGLYQVNISLGVSVHCYKKVGQYDIVASDLALYFDSVAPPGCPVAVRAESVEFLVDKIGSDLGNHKAEFIDADDPPPGSVQACKLMQAPAIDTDSQTRAIWAKNVLTLAIGLFEELNPVSKALSLIGIATSYAPPKNGGWWKNVGWSETHGWSYWHDTGFPVSTDPAEQYCFNTLWWRQLQIEPSSYYGIAVRARIVLPQVANDLFGTATVITDPIYLQIKRKTGGGGCPYVHVWNGEEYVIDNNILPTSEASNGSDVKDYYKLEQTLVPTFEGNYFSLYPLQIREFENEHSYIDQAKLYTVDHNSDVNIAATPSGEILTYKAPNPPASCIDNNGTNRLGEILQMEGNISDPTTYFEGYPNDYLVLNFGKVDSENAKLILRTDWKKHWECIEVQVKDDNVWQTVEVIAPRAYWSMEAANLSPYVNKTEDLWIRLLWKDHHRLDYVGLDTTPQDSFTTRSANPILAIHSSEGNVRQKLLASDNIYAELTPGQTITLTFIIPNNLSEERTFILYTEGHYHTIT